ncbi:unnamed protein product [Ectocarpus sp. CCAP 1310/34]|nr:unnamed protein product [Ectocarpus sp. CCAP 1310/34]
MSKREGKLKQKMEDEMCEASVILGRLGHVNERHGEAIGLLEKSLVDAGARDAIKSATLKVRSEYDSLKQKLEELYQQSIQDLQAHRSIMEGPTLARMEATGDWTEGCGRASRGRDEGGDGQDRSGSSAQARFFSVARAQTYPLPVVLDSLIRWVGGSGST